MVLIMLGLVERPWSTDRRGFPAFFMEGRIPMTRTQAYTVDTWMAFRGVTSLPAFDPPKKNVIAELTASLGLSRERNRKVSGFFMAYLRFVSL